MRLLHEDRELLGAFRRGEAGALSYVYRAHVQRLAEYLRRGFAVEADGRHFAGLSTASEIEDAVQDIFVRVFREDARQRYDGIRPFEGWLLGIARNYVISDLRRRRPASEPLPADGVSAQSPDAGLESIVEAREVEAIIHAFLATLDAREVGIYEARFSRQLSQEEAAAALGLTRIQVRRSEARIKARLLEYLQQRGYLAAYSAERLRNSRLR